MLTLRIDWEDSVFIFDKSNNQFNRWQESIFHAHPVDGAFTTKTNPLGNCEVTFNATSLRQFSVAVAFLNEGIWQIKYFIKVSPEEGVVCVPFSYKFGIQAFPPEFPMTTAVLMGIQTTQDRSTVALKIFANQSGIIFDDGNDNDFNGYYGHVEYNGLNKSLIVSETLQAKFAKNMRFDKTLYLAPIKSVNILTIAPVNLVTQPLEEGIFSKDSTI